MRTWWSSTLLALLAVSWIACDGPSRHPAPLVPEIGADPVPPAEEEPDPAASAKIIEPDPEPVSREESVEAAARSGGAVPAESAGAADADAAAQKETPSESTTEPGEEESSKKSDSSSQNAAADAKADTKADAKDDGSGKNDFDFLIQLGMDIAGRADEETTSLAIFPAAHANPLFGRLELSQLGWELGQFVERELRKELGAPFKILGPRQFAEAIQKTNRSLADITQVPEIFNLGRRIDVDYIIIGMIYDGESKFDIAYDCIDLDNYFKISVNSWSFEASDPVGERLYRKFKDENGKLILTDQYPIGAQAKGGDRDLATELNWLFARAMRDIVGASGPVLKDLPIAVLPVRLPEDINFLHFQSMFLNYVDVAKREMVKKGLSESEAMADGPHRILGQTFATLTDAEQYARQLVLQKKTTNAGQFQSTISRILFDQLEKLEEEFGVQVVKHEDIVNEALAYTQEELALVKSGVLAEDKRSSFQAKGAGVLLFSEFVEGEKWFEFYFQLRRLDDLSPLHSKLRAVLEPEFGYKLKDFLGEGKQEKAVDSKPANEPAKSDGGN